MIKAWAHQLRLEGGVELELQPDSIVVFVGANNSGKSVALRAVQKLMEGPQPSTGSVISGLAVAREGTLQELREYLAPYRHPHHFGHIQIGQSTFPSAHLSELWGHGVLGPIAVTMLSVLTTEARLSDCAPAPNIDLENALLQHPFQRMLADRHLENRTSDTVRKAFGMDLVIDRGAGATIPAYVGDRPELNEGEERIDLSYARKVRQLGRLNEQGDGVRSFVSVIARISTEERPVVIIDEPEAFLHPPQARLVGRHLAEQDRQYQTFIATHSSDVLQGILSADRLVPVVVIRLARKPGASSAVALESAQIRELWQDPILRFSNILDGLFHEGVVITESDADCRFYEALVNAVEPDETRPALHYAYSGGKERLPVVIKALIKLGVPVATVVDFDTLNNEASIERICNAAGGDWSKIAGDWASVKSAVESRSAFLGATEFASAVREQIKLCRPGEAVSRNVLSSIRKLTRQASPWDNCKQAGLAALPHGPAHQAARRLLDYLKSIGIFVVPVGEIEGFNRSIGRHGPRWVEEALRCDIASAPELNDARAFVRDIVARFKNGGEI